MKNKITPFLFQGRVYRVVCKGLGTYRLQDNRGFTMLVSEQELMEMIYR